MTDPDESPTPQDVLDHVFSHLLQPVIGGADPFDHFFQVVKAAAV